MIVHCRDEVVQGGAEVDAAESRPGCRCQSLQAGVCEYDFEGLRWRVEEVQSSYDRNRERERAMQCNDL